MSGMSSSLTSRVSEALKEVIEEALTETVIRGRKKRMTEKVKEPDIAEALGDR
jgi:hypothetical protein